MLAELIPAINVDTFEELARRVKLVEPHTRWVHIDVADGTFTKNTIWHSAADLLNLDTNLKVEVHLMIEPIERRIDEWLLPQIQRIIFHFEATENPEFVIKKIKDAGKEVGIAIAPDTSWHKLLTFCGKIDLFQVLAVYPGLAGQKPVEDPLHKVRHLRKEYPDAIIEIDGGIKKNNAKRAAVAGADILVAASEIFDAGNVEDAVKNLKVELST